MVSDEGKFSMGHMCNVPSKAGLTKEVVFHEGGPSKEALLYSSVHVHVWTYCIYLDVSRIQ